MIKVGAVDDHPALLLGLQAVLSAVPRIDFVATATTVPELLDLAAGLDVVLLDLRLDDGSRPADNVRLLTEAGAEVVVYTQGRGSAGCREAIAAGALTVIDKSDPLEALIEVIDESARGVTHPTAAMAQALDTDGLLVPQLSAQEREALRLYAANLPAKSVARRMGISEGTVKVYLRRIRAKYWALNRPAGTKLDLYQRAVEDGIVD